MCLAPPGPYFGGTETVGMSHSQNAFIFDSIICNSSVKCLWGHGGLWVIVLKFCISNCVYNCLRLFIFGMSYSHSRYVASYSVLFYRKLIKCVIKSAIMKGRYWILYRAPRGSNDIYELSTGGNCIWDKNSSDTYKSGTRERILHSTES